MSYYTQYILKWNTPEPTEDQLVTAIAPVMLETDQEIDSHKLEFVHEVIQGNERAKWYNSDHQVGEISKRWPDTVFTMRCCGEDGEQWVTFFKNGLALTEPLIEPEFNDERFAEHAAVPTPMTDQS